jgi:hypothetical protein
MKSVRTEQDRVDGAGIVVIDPASFRDGALCYLAYP